MLQYTVRRTGTFGLQRSKLDRKMIAQKPYRKGPAVEWGRVLVMLLCDGGV